MAFAFKGKKERNYKMVIAVCNQKGGVGKTATAQAIANGASKLGLITLAIDADPQRNLSFSMGGNPADAGIYELIFEHATPGQTIQHTGQGDILVSKKSLVLADTILTGDDRLTALKNALKPIKKKYDVIVIDCPPTLSTLLLNALIAADKVVIPLTADGFSLQGLYDLVETINDAQKINKALQIGGVVLTRDIPRTVLSRDVTKVLQGTCDELGIPFYNTRIPEGIAVREAQLARASLFDYAPKSKPAKAYMELLDEILKGGL